MNHTAEICVKNKNKQKAFIFVCLLQMKEGGKVHRFILVHVWIIRKRIGRNTEENLIKGRRNHLKFQRIKREPNGTPSVEPKEEEGPFCDPSLQYTHPEQYWCDIPLPNTPPAHHPPPPHYNPHHPFLQSSCVNPGVALPLGCGLPGAEADAGICEQNSLWNPLHTHTCTLARTHTFQPYLSLCPLLSVPVSGVYLFIFTSPPSPSPACNEPTVALSTWHGPKLKWWAPPTPTFYFTPCIAASVRGQYTNRNQVIWIRYSASEGFLWIYKDNSTEVPNPEI